MDIIVTMKLTYQGKKDRKPMNCGESTGRK